MLLSPSLFRVREPGMSNTLKPPRASDDVVVLKGVVGGSAIEGFDLESVLSRIHYFRIHDYVQQLAVVQTLPAFLEYAHLLRRSTSATVLA